MLVFSTSPCRCLSSISITIQHSLRLSASGSPPSKCVTPFFFASNSGLYLAAEELCANPFFRIRFIGTSLTPCSNVFASASSRSLPIFASLDSLSCGTKLGSILSLQLLSLVEHILSGNRHWQRLLSYLNHSSLHQPSLQIRAESGFFR